MNEEGTFHALFWLLLAGLLIMRVYFYVQLRRSGEHVLPDQAAIRQEGKALFAVRFVGFFLLIGMLVAYAFNPSWMQAVQVDLPNWSRWAGFGIGVASLVLAFWAQAELGRQFSAQLHLRADHHLVTSGPYARIRHPLYLNLLGIGASFALVSASWIFILFALAAIAGLLARIPREEQMMLAEFGEEYRAYMRTTKRLIPGIW